MKYLKTFNEKTSYHNLHGDDVADITKVEVDKFHDYERCDGVLYELSNSGENIILDIDQIEATPENTFYQDQIERYIEYIEEDGILETLPVTEHRVCNNFEQMLEYLDDPDNFDDLYEISKFGIDMDNDRRRFYMSSSDYTHKKLLDLKIFDLICNPEDFGFNYDTNLKNIKTIEDLDKYYNDEIDEDNENKIYDEDLYFTFTDVIKYFDDMKNYTLTDGNHRFQALKQMNKKRVYVEII